jgi:hypothetical protein
MLLISHQWICSLSYGENCPQRKRFQDAQDIMKNVTAELNAIPLDASVSCFQKLFKRCHKCIQIG